MKITQKSPRNLSIDLGSPEVLKAIFSPTNLNKALRRIAKRDKDDFITHPLKPLILTEYESQIAEQLVRSVPTGTWSPSGAYVSLTSKRSGAYRELVFPALIDGIVGRCIIDAIEPLVTRDDDGKTFSGRSHFSNTREPGDYDDWFQVWQDFTSAVDKAARSDGFTYVFDTDVNDFFPSVDRVRAKALIAARTSAHPSLLELLFYCLEAWIPRFAYAPMTGLPVEPNDVSRVVAHAYLKSVDAVFKKREDCIYLRYVDDTVVFCRDVASANAIRRLHHLELRQLGLNPNAAKSEIMAVEQFQSRRHRDINLRLQAAKNKRDKAAIDKAAIEWFDLDPREINSWDKVAKVLYSIARQLKAEALRPFVVRHSCKVPSVARVALRYLVTFDLTEEELRELLILAKDDLDMETAICLATSILDARIDPAWSGIVVDTALGQLRRRINHHGTGYLKAQWLLVVHKYGARRDRDQLRSLGPNLVDDSQWRLHYLYVAIATGTMKIADAGTTSTLANSDIQLAVRLCSAAKDGRLVRRDRVLQRLISPINGRASIAGRHLPFLRLLLEPAQETKRNSVWLKSVLEHNGKQQISDRVVLEFLEQQYKRLTA